MSIDENVHVVIVGGGFGGIAAAQQLKHHGVPFMLIDILDAFHHNVAALRASVQPGMQKSESECKKTNSKINKIMQFIFLYVIVGFAKQTFIPYKETFGVNFLQGRVIRIDTETQTVVLDNGKVSDIAMLQYTKTKYEKMSLYSMCQNKSTGSTVFTPHSVHWNKRRFPRQTQFCRHLPSSHSEV